RQDDHHPVPAVLVVPLVRPQPEVRQAPLEPLVHGLPHPPPHRIGARRVTELSDVTDQERAHAPRPPPPRSRPHGLRHEHLTDGRRRLHSGPSGSQPARRGTPTARNGNTPLAGLPFRMIVLAVRLLPLSPIEGSRHL